MCLLIVFSQVFPELPLVVAANRDEWLGRPTTEMAILRAGSPRILGGRDEVAGGTWMATSAAGVVAALTNRPLGTAGPPARRSRGELPLFLASHPSAAAAAQAFGRTFRPADYNPAWLLVGDRDSLQYIDMSGGDGAASPPTRALAPGLHILENRELDADSPKTRHVRALLAGIEQRGDLVDALTAVLRDHELPHGAEGSSRPLASEAACVHAGPYGTRSSSIVLVPRNAGALPIVRVAPGPPCATAFEDVSALWEA